MPGEFEAQEHDQIDDATMDSINEEDRDLGSLSSSFLPHQRDPSSLLEKMEYSSAGHPNTTFDEKEMNRQLADVESSFLPEISQIQPQDGQARGADDTFAFGVLNDNIAIRKRPHPIDVTSAFRDIDTESKENVPSPNTPDQTFKTPAISQNGFEGAEDSQVSDSAAPNTSQLEQMSSSPATVARTVSRVQSLATIGGYETAAEDRDDQESPSKKPRTVQDEEAVTPRGTTHDHLNIPASDAFSGSLNSTGTQRHGRPKYLQSRTSSARLSYDSVASSTTDTSDATLGADFALQSGGAAPARGRRRDKHLAISRQVSLGSIASSVSGLGLSEDEGRSNPGFNPDLSTLQEESPRSSKDMRQTPTGPETPKVTAVAMPTDTVIAANVRDIEVPGTFARQYRQERDVSPSKTLTMAGMTPGPKRGLTLKEHRSTVDKLSKENFDLKMKIYFLDQALQKRSEDGIKEMITENVQLKSDRMRLEKDNHMFRKQIRQLQQKLDEKNVQSSPKSDQGYGTDDERSPTAEEELLYLRERVETTEIEIEKLRSENLAKEGEKRRLAEMVRSLGESNPGASDVGSREERDMWKDMLEAESIAREQADDANKKLREEVARLRQDSHGLEKSKSRKGYSGSVISRASSGEAFQVHSAELERLRHEVSELQKTISAQASALTSRNKEKERLYQEIEDLKLRMGGGRSIAGDSILDRSASRIRSHSRASNVTRMSRISDQERDELEAKINQLRDEVNQLKMDNQNLQREADEAVQELDAIDLQAEADARTFNQEIADLAAERDEALRAGEDQEQAFQALKEEAQNEIDGLGDELDAKAEECEHLSAEVQSLNENLKALQSEMHSASEGLVRLEDDAQQNLARYQKVKAELDDSNREIESMEKSLAEAESKIQRLTVQQESSHNEIAFLREEQDGDKIKIGDLESLLKKVHFNLESEREKARELDGRLNEERQQHNMITSKKEKDVQRLITGLNQEVSKTTEELRQLRKMLSTREIELSSWKDKAEEMEQSLRSIFDDPSASRASLVTAVEKMAQDLESATIDLESTRRRLDEQQSIMVNRDQLLENNSHEFRKIEEALDRERQGRRQDKYSFEQALRSQQQATRAMTATSSKINELEQARSLDRKRLTQIETQFKDQLAERNQVLLTLWKKLSALCGSDWAHNNSLINGNLPSQEVIGNMLFWPGFNRNIILAAKQVEGTFATFREKIKKVERELYKDYRNLEHTLEQRTKKLERIEESWEKVKLRQAEMEGQLGHSRTSSSRSGLTNEVSKLKGENRLLKAELQLLQQQHHRHSSRATRPESRMSVRSSAKSVDGPAALDGALGLPPRTSSVRKTSRGPGLDRRETTNIVEHLASVDAGMASPRSSSISSRASGYVITNDRDRVPDRGLMIPAGAMHAPHNGNFSLPPREPAPMPPALQTNGSGNEGAGYGATGPGQEKWIHRLRELERRLKAEREARLLDRTGMRKRLEERDAVNEELRMELERERVRNSLDMSGEHQRRLEGSTNENKQYRQHAIGGPDERYDDSSLLEDSELLEEAGDEDDTMRPQKIAIHAPNARG
jgi:chromosome segregation ATPase